MSLNYLKKIFILITGIFFAAFVANSLYAMGIVPSEGQTTLASNTFIYYPKKLKWVAVKNGQVIKSGKGSGGSNYCRDLKRACRTPTGTFHIISQKGADCRSSRYPLGKGGSKMPYCSFFSQYYAVHGSYEVPNYNASHGCIRVHPADAKWLQQNFLKVGTTVVVKPY